MARIFYTEQDIEDLIRRGVKSLETSANVSLTALAYEKAHKLGLTLVEQDACPPEAPVRPYLSLNGSTRRDEKKKQAIVGEPPLRPVAGSQGVDDLRSRIRTAVLQRLGGQVDPQLLDQVIERVLSSTGLGQK